MLFRKHEPEPFVEIEFPREFRIGDVYSMIVFDLDYENLEYGYRFSGPWEPEAGQRFDKMKILLRSVRQGDRRPGCLARQAGLERHLSAPRPAVIRRLRLGGRLRSRDRDERSRHLRGARSRFHGAPILEGLGPGNVRRASREDPVSQVAGRQLHRVIADLRIRRMGKQPPAPRNRGTAPQLLGVQHGWVFCAQGWVCGHGPPWHAGGRAEEPHQGAAPRAGSR